MQKPTTICIFGDSTAWGAWDMEKGGWVNRLWLEVSERTNGECDIYNLSISGGTTQTILDRFETEAKIREADALIFQSGGNDAYIRDGAGVNNISLEQFRANLESIIEKAKKITPKIIFMGFEVVDEAKTTPVAWSNISYFNSEIKRYNGELKKVCQEQGVLFLDNFSLLTLADLEDGLHPNASGHEKTFQQVRDFLIKNNWI
jgi:acyl-CoA thioesterase I